MYCKVNNCRFASSHTTPAHKCGTCGGYGHGQVECKNNELREFLKKFLNNKMPLDKRCTLTPCNHKWSHSVNAHHCKICNINGHSISTCPLNQIFYEIQCPLCMKINKISSDQKKIYGLEDKCKVCQDNEVNVFLPECGHGCLCIDCVQIMYENDKNINIDDIIVEESKILNHTRSQANDVFESNNSKIYTIVYAGMGCSWYVRRESNTSLLEGFFMHNDNWGQYGETTDDRPKLNIFINGYTIIENNQEYI